MIVEEIMTQNVLTLTPTDTVESALKLMHANTVRHIPLVDENKQLVGLVTERDIKSAAPPFLEKELLLEQLKKPLKDIMKVNIITGHPLDFVEEITVLFYEHRIGCLPIVSDHELVGIITGTDLLHTMVELTGANQPGSQIEIKVPNQPGVLYDAAKFFREHKINVLSVLVYPDKSDAAYKILVFRVATMNPLEMIANLKEAGLDVLWPNMPGMNI